MRSPAGGAPRRSPHLCISIKLDAVTDGLAIQQHLVTVCCRVDAVAGLDKPRNRGWASVSLNLVQCDEGSRVVGRRRHNEARQMAGSRWNIPTAHCEGRVELVDDLVFPFERRYAARRMQRHEEVPEDPLLAVQGVHPKVIQAVLGWEQSSMIDCSALFVDQMRNQAAGKMDDILAPVAVRDAQPKPN